MYSSSSQYRIHTLTMLFSVNFKMKKKKTDLTLKLIFCVYCLAEKGEGGGNNGGSAQEEEQTGKQTIKFTHKKN